MSQGVTAAQVKAIAGTSARADLVDAIVRGWPAAAAKARLTSRDRAAHFLAQIMTETGGLRILSESGAYSERQILKVFGAKQYSKPLGGRGHSAGITPAEARRIAALPVAQRGPELFDRVYGIGNPTKAKEFGHTRPGQGWLYRGGGMMQCTGLANYSRRQKETGLPLVAHPELLHQPDSAFTAAYLEWAQDGRCNAAADRDDVEAVRLIVNGGDNGLAECKVYLARAKKALAGYVAPAPAASQVDAELEPIASPALPAPPAAVPVAGDGVQGDPLLYSVQQRLKAMNYTPGVVVGVWGGMTAGAIAGFINDRGGRIPVPASLDAFNQVRDDLVAELGRAEAEGFKRPVTAARASADPDTVAAVAPEVVPAKRNFLTAMWGSVVALLTAIWQAISDSIGKAWDFFTDHKDDLPAADSGVVQTVWSYVAGVPTFVWLLGGAGLLLFIALNSRSSVKRIEQSVQTGARQ